MLEYFSADPHERVKVTCEYLEQRFFDEEKYLGDLYQLPKFPVDNSLRTLLLVLVAFKAGRIDAFYLPDSVHELDGLKKGDLVMVEADRGRDMGMVVKMNISIDEARLLKLLQFLEQQAALSENVSVSDLSVKSLQTSGHHGGHHGSNAPPTLHFPKLILSLAQNSEIVQILNKKQDEEKACRLCLAKIASTISSGDAGLISSSDLMQMKLIDAEYQFDRRKLIFYYSTSKRIDFRDLVRELFRIYKTRIWMCAVNGIPYVAQRKKQGGRGKSRSNEVNERERLESGDFGKSEIGGERKLITSERKYERFEKRGYGEGCYQRRVSENSESSQLQNEVNFGIPRNLQEVRVDEESSNFDSGELLVLKSLVDTLNH